MPQPPGLHFCALKQKLGGKLDGLQKKINLNRQWEKIQRDNVVFSLMLTSQKIKYLFIFFNTWGKISFLLLFTYSLFLLCVS